MKIVAMGLMAALAWLTCAAHAELRVFACEPEWAALSREIGGDSVSVDSATTGMQDVHYIQARPSLIAKVRRADLVFCTGADLEVGWLPLLLRQAGNANVQPGRNGYLEAAQFVSMLEVPSSVDRASGDIHPYGNPHIQLDPRNIALVAAGLVARLVLIDPAHRQVYESRYGEFTARWNAAWARWQERARPLNGVAIVTHHRSWIYLEHWLNLENVGNLEPKPGIPPTAASLANLLDGLSGRSANVIVRSAYEDERASTWLAERIHVPALVLPHTVGSTGRAKDLFALFDEILDQLTPAVTAAASS